MDTAALFDLHIHELATIVRGGSHFCFYSTIMNTYDRLKFQMEPPYNDSALLSCSALIRAKGRAYEDVGYLDVKINFDTAYIIGVGINSEYRRNGIATRMYIFMAEELSKQGVILSSGDSRTEASEMLWKKLWNAHFAERYKGGGADRLSKDLGTTNKRWKYEQYTLKNLPYTVDTTIGFASLEMAKEHAEFNSKLGNVGTRIEKSFSVPDTYQVSTIYRRKI